MVNSKSEDLIFKKLDRTIYLLEYLLVMELAKTDLNWSEIGKHIKVEKARINTMLKGANIKRNKK